MIKDEKTSELRLTVRVETEEFVTAVWCGETSQQEPTYHLKPERSKEQTQVL